MSSDNISGIGRVERTTGGTPSQAHQEAASVGAAHARTQGASESHSARPAAAADQVDVLPHAGQAPDASALADAFGTHDKGLFIRNEHRPLPPGLQEKCPKKLDAEKCCEHKRTLEKDQLENKAMSAHEKANLEKHHQPEKQGEIKPMSGGEKGCFEKHHPEKDNEIKPLAGGGEKGHQPEKAGETKEHHVEKGVLLEKLRHSEKGGADMEKGPLEKGLAHQEKGLAHGEKGLAHGEKGIEKENWEKAVHPEKGGANFEKDKLEKGLRAEKGIEKDKLEKALHAEKGIEKENWEKAVHPEKGLRFEKSEEKCLEKLAREKSLGEKDLEIQPLRVPEGVSPDRFFF